MKRAATQENTRAAAVIAAVLLCLGLSGAALAGIEEHFPTGKPDPAKSSTTTATTPSLEGETPPPGWEEQEAWESTFAEYGLELVQPEEAFAFDDFADESGNAASEAAVSETEGLLLLEPGEATLQADYSQIQSGLRAEHETAGCAGGPKATGSLASALALLLIALRRRQVA